MAGELSPDRLYYWDGARWLSAVSPDGAWRWDGTSWRPAAAAPASRGAWWWMAAIVVAVVVVVSAGTYLASGGIARRVANFLPATISTCTSPLAKPGAALASGEQLCGGRLGTEFVLADCMLTSGTPDGIDVWQKSYSPTEGSWMHSTVNTGPAGCNLAASPDTDVSFDTKDQEPASTVVVADFTVTDLTGGIGIQLACSDEAGCVDISVYSDGFYSLDEGIPHDGWDNLTKGYISFGSPIKTDRANRMILRLTGNTAEVWINDELLTRGTTKRVQTSGFVDFYVDNRDGKALESVWLRRLYVFQSVSG